uniref:ARVCF delta catenin family member b n=1 Tax=Maylandia zebra TaxID=106582 RepID=A0A3P9BYP9_9CICH
REGEERHPYIHGMYSAPLAQPERGSMASLDRMGGRHLPEVIAMLGHPIDPVKSNAAAYLQHLCYENDKIKKDVRQLKGIPVLVGLLDHPKSEVHRKACGALRNISYGKDNDNKVAIKNCDGIPALIRLLRKTNDMEVRELITGTLWNLNVSSDGAEARRRLRECEGLVDALLHALQSAVGKKDMDNKSVENCVCIMRNLSYHVHKEVPGAEKYQDPSALTSLSFWLPILTSVFVSLYFPAGFELLYQPEVVRLYLSLLTESQNYNTLEAAAGALQNLSAGQWTVSTGYIRATVRKEKGLPILVELLRSDSDKVVRAVAIALRNLSIDRRNKDLIGSYAMRDLVSNLPSGQQRPAKNLEEDTVVAILNTIHEIVTDSSENARSLIQAQAIEKLVAINRTSVHVLQTVWSYKELRNALAKDGWNKSHFQVWNQSRPLQIMSIQSVPGYDDTTLPLMEKNQGQSARVVECMLL